MRTFSRLFGAEGWVGLKFTNEPWYFLMLEDLEDTGACWAVSRDLAKRRGLSINELMETE